MIGRPAFKPFYNVQIVRGEGSFLLSENGHILLTGHLNDLVVPLIDGRRTADEIVDAVGNRVSMEEAYYALAMLEKQGHLIEADDAMPPELAAYWTALGFDMRAVHERLGKARVSVQCWTPDMEEPLREALAHVGITLSDQEDGELLLVAVDDYLETRLAEFNAARLKDRRPWLLFKPTGLISWQGPLFVPGRTGCWECLADRLRGNREVEQYLIRRGYPGPFRVSLARQPAVYVQACQAVALQAAIFLISGTAATLENNVVTTNTAQLQTNHHTLVRRPQCPACGNRELLRVGDHVVTLPERSGGSLQDGGHRSTTPEATYERFRHHVSPITGVVSQLTSVINLEGSPLRVYQAGHNFAFKNDSLYFLREGLRTRSAGKGMTEAQARTSALCEALERYSGIFRGDERRIRTSFADLGERAIHPNDCMLYSELQYQEREAWMARGSRFQVVPHRFPTEVRLEWSPVWSLTRRHHRYLPTGYLYYGYPMSEDEFFYWADSNGNAAGNTLEEAILQGFLELIERDSVCLWWYNRLQRPAVELSSLNNPYLKNLRAHYHEHGREFWVLDLTADTGIPTFAAISRCIDRAKEDIVFGFGAHLDAQVAILRAVSEMNQFMPAVLQRRHDGSTHYAVEDRECLDWWQNATLANQPYLRPLPDHFTRTAGQLPALSSGDVSEDVKRCVGIVHDLGMETLVLNQTRPDVGLPVAKVVVPGLRHFWARYAPGRLYNTPVKLGWLQQPLPESVLNPIPLFV
jgi:ribosomal protein S12 methylthiotransferase accessory factor